MIRKKRISLAENEKVVKARAQIKNESNKYILKPDQENKNSLKSSRLGLKNAYKAAKDEREPCNYS